MGYTHYWTHKNRFTNDEWRTVREDINAILCAAQDSGVQLGDSCGTAPLTEFNQIWTNGNKHDSVIVFNGLGEESHETFVIYQNGNGWNFCKTARKAYDVAVTACLVYLESTYPKKFTASSDGQVGDWQAGLDLARAALPRLDNVLKIPRDIGFDALFSRFIFSGGKFTLAALQDGTLCVIDHKALQIVGLAASQEGTDWLTGWAEGINDKRRAMLPAKEETMTRWDARKVRTMVECAQMFGYLTKEPADV